MEPIPVFECPLCLINFQELVETRDGEKICLWCYYDMYDLPRREHADKAE